MRKQKLFIAALFIGVFIFSALSGKAQSDSLIADETNVTVLNSYYKKTMGVKQRLTQ